MVMCTLCVRACVCTPPSVTKCDRHLSSLLCRPGIVADCSLTNFEPASCAPHTTDNDGLWTSWLVAAEAFRYVCTYIHTYIPNRRLGMLQFVDWHGYCECVIIATAFPLRYQVDKNETARENAWQLFKGMEFLNTVSDGLDCVCMCAASIVLCCLPALSPWPSLSSLSHTHTCTHTHTHTHKHTTYIYTLTSPGHRCERFNGTVCCP